MTISRDEYVRIKIRLGALEEGLIVALLNYKQEDVQTRRDGMYRAILAVLDFIKSIPSWNEQHLEDPLRELALALKELENGHQPEILTAKKISHRPENPDEQIYVQAWAVLIMECLFRSGLPIDQAARKAADAYDKKEYRISSGFGYQSVSATTVINWRKSFNSPSGNEIAKSYLSGRLSKIEEVGMAWDKAAKIIIDGGKELYPFSLVPRKGRDLDDDESG